MKPSTKHITKVAEDWKELNNDSWDIGHDSINFVSCGEQWDDNSQKTRAANRKETLTFNMLWKHQQQLKAYGKKLELTLDINPLSDDPNLEETKCFRALLNHILLREAHQRVFVRSLDDVYDFGQSVIFVNVTREDNETLNKTIDFRLIKAYRAFFDNNAPSPTLHDGQYCGYVTELSGKKLKEMYPNTRNPKQKNNTVYNYWYKEHKSVNYVELEGGVFKREDLLAYNDVVLEGGETRKENNTIIMHMVVRDGQETPLIKPTEWPGEHLPMVYNYGLTHKTKDGPRSFPATYHMQGAQQLHNYVGSQIASMVRNVTSDKWFVDLVDIESKDQEEALQEINSRDGAFPIPPGKVERHQPQQLPPALAQIYVQSNQEMSDLGGAYMSNNGSEVKAISGTALDKMFNKGDLLQNNVITAHIDVITTVGLIVKGQIPKVFTEQRVLDVCIAGKNQERIIINQKMPGKILNNISNLNRDYHYTINAGVSTEIEKQNTLASMVQLFQVNPQSVGVLSDIFAKMLPTQYSHEIARRLSTTIDPDLVKYSQGEMSEDEYKQKQEQKQQQQTQMISQQMEQQQQIQQQMAQGKQALVQNKIETDQAAGVLAQKEEERKQIETQLKVAEAQVKMALDAEELQQSAIAQRNIQELEQRKLDLQHSNALLNAGYGHPGHN